jgi:hypothetical protein
MSKVTAFIIGGVLAAGVTTAVVVPVALTAGSMIGAGTDAIKPISCGTPGTIQQVSRNTPKVSGYSAAQIRNATDIVATGQEMKVPPRGWIVAVATAMQESTLHNYGDLGARNDHDSQGLFQQRPSQGWGTVAQVRDPKHASKSFYSRLVKIKGWQTMSLTRAAQRVQRSAYPNAYAKWESDASRLVDIITGGASKTAVSATTIGTCADTNVEVSSAGWTRPVPAEVGSGFRTASRPSHNGVDLSAKRGVPIKAASAGTVIHMECDNDNTAPYRCDQDGSPSTPGCGWYLDIKHAGGWITRYCHMLKKPLVGEGDKVTAGQQIGVVGTSGHSSGPHLHFEVHKGDRSSGSAIDPVKFMKDRAPLGTGGKDT